MLTGGSAHRSRRRRAHVRRPAALVPAVLAALGLLAGAGPAGASAPAPATFRNPIAPVLAGVDSPDPFIFVAHHRYWLTHTAPGIVVRSATSLGGLASARPQKVWPRPGAAVPHSRCCEFWAPEFHRLRGPHGFRWYVYSGVDDGDLNHHRLQVLESAADDPRGPYTFKAILSLGENYAIDPTILTVRGRTYVLYSGAQGNIFTPSQLSIARLSQPWIVSGRPVLVSAPTLPWETNIFAIDEGPEILLHGPWLHVIYSASWCAKPDYKLGRLTVRADADLLDPLTWAAAKAPQPVFTKDPARDVYGPGHGSFFRSPDGRENWQVYHATDGDGDSCSADGLPRTTRAQRFTYAPDGTPRFGRPVALDTDLRAPSGDPTLERQAEDAQAVAASDAPHSAVSDPAFVGGRAERFDPRRSGAALTLRLGVPRSGRYRVLARVRTGPGQGQLRLAAAGTRHPTPTADAYAARPGVRELDLGTTALPAGATTVRLTIPGRSAASTGLALELDQLRLVAEPARPTGRPRG